MEKLEKVANSMLLHAINNRSAALPYSLNVICIIISISLADCFLEKDHHDLTLAHRCE